MRSYSNEAKFVHTGPEGVGTQTPNPPQRRRVCGLSRTCFWTLIALVILGAGVGGCDGADISFPRNTNTLLARGKGPEGKIRRPLKTDVGRFGERQRPAGLWTSFLVNSLTEFENKCLEGSEQRFQCPVLFDVCQFLGFCPERKRVTGYDFRPERGPVRE